VLADHLDRVGPARPEIVGDPGPAALHAEKPLGHLGRIGQRGEHARAIVLELTGDLQGVGWLAHLIFCLVEDFSFS
jgi:hypothetical protein